MEKKIKDYVDYQFRFDNREGLDELKAEIVANLADRYNDNFSKHQDKERAYIEAIKQMGNFSDNLENKIDEQYSIKPSIPDICMLLSVILSIFAVLLFFINPLTGTITTIISILLFSGGAFYLYSYSQFIRKDKMDIETHNIILKKIFKNVKTNFVFWTINLTLILVFLISSLFTSIYFLLSLDEIEIETIIVIYIFSFIVSLIIIVCSFIKLYKKLMNKYYLLTGDRDLNSYMSDAIGFVDVDNNSKKRIFKGYHKSYLYSFFNSKFFIPLYGVIFILPTILLPGADGVVLIAHLTSDPSPIVILYYITMVVVISLFYKSRIVLLTTYTGWFALLYIFIESSELWDHTYILGYLLFMISILLIIQIILVVVSMLKKYKNRVAKRP